MNGVHDLGGMHGFGPVDIESGKKLFHAEWEKRVFGMTVACGFLGVWNIDQSRSAREAMEPGEYLQTGYYQHWLHGLESLLVKRGLLTACEMKNKKPDSIEKVAVPADRVAAILTSGGPADCTSATQPQYKTGETIVLKNHHPQGHTRAPRFIRGKRGVIHRYHGSHVLPDVSSQSEGVKTGAHLYSVRFEAVELWGENGDHNGAVYVDVFEPYIQNTV